MTVQLALCEGTLDFPQDALLQNAENLRPVLYVSVGNDAFPLRWNIHFLEDGYTSTLSGSSPVPCMDHYGECLWLDQSTTESWS